MPTVKYPDYVPVVIQLDLTSEMWKLFGEVLQQPDKWNTSLFKSTDSDLYTVKPLSSIPRLIEIEPTLTLTHEQVNDYMQLQFIGSKAVDIIQNLVACSRTSGEHVLLSGNITMVCHLLVSFYPVLYKLGLISGAELNTNYKSVVECVLNTLPLESY